MPSGRLFPLLLCKAQGLYPLQSKDRQAPGPRRSASKQVAATGKARSVAKGATSPAGPIEWSRRLRSAAETDRLGRIIGQSLRGNEVLALFGDLGTGKTTLVRGLAAGLGVPPRNVSSPTFALIRECQGRLPLVHADLYRIESTTELDHLGLTDYFDGQYVLAIEWADKAGSTLPEDCLELYLSHQGRTVRNVVMKGTGPSSQALLSRVIKRMTPRENARQARGKGRERR